MPATQQDTLPESIASRLTDEQRQAVLEAPRGLRLAALAAALGIDENAALQMVAESARLDIATNLETDPGARGLLPARLVHDFQLIPIRVGPPASADGDPEPGGGHPPPPRVRLASRPVDGRLAADIHPEAARVAHGRARARAPAHHRELRRRLRRARGQRRGLRRPRGAAAGRRGGRGRGRRRRALRDRRHLARRSTTRRRTSTSSPRRASCGSATAWTGCSCPASAREPPSLPGRHHLAP